MQCKNKLKQVGLGMANHVATMNSFPSGGWGWWWVGDGDRGTQRLTGIGFERSQSAYKNVEDGTANTCLVCEKHLNPDHYDTGLDPADNESWCTGYNNDNNRNASEAPLQDTPGFGSTFRFVSVHAGGFNAVFCDGSVHSISYSIDLQVHQRLVNRQDGQPVDLGAL